MSNLLDSEYIAANFALDRLAASIVLPGNVVVYGFYVYSSNAAAQYIHVFDGTGALATGAVPTFVLPVGSHYFVAAYYGKKGRRCQSGLTLANSSTEATFTAGSADCFFDIQYDTIEV